MAVVIGLDVGGANVKACCLDIRGGAVVRGRAKAVYHEVWRDPEGLRAVLGNMRQGLCREVPGPLRAVALTMTAELCDVFPSKAQGTEYITALTRTVFADVPVFLWTMAGEFIKGCEASGRTAAAAAANWLASATALAESPLGDDSPALLADLGSTTADLIVLPPPGQRLRGRTDTERLTAGELVYTGVLRTPVGAVADTVYIDGLPCRVTSEYFAVMADVYRLLGQITDAEYLVAVPDSGARTAEACARRLARVVAAEPETLGQDGVYALAGYIREKQIQQIVGAVWQILSRSRRPWPARLITAGQGDFLLREIARRLGWEASPWWQLLPGGEAKREYPLTAYAVAWLLAGWLAADPEEYSDHH